LVTPGIPSATPRLPCTTPRLPCTTPGLPCDHILVTLRSHSGYPAITFWLPCDHILAILRSHSGYPRLIFGELLSSKHKSFSHPGYPIASIYSPNKKPKTLKKKKGKNKNNFYCSQTADTASTSSYQVFTSPS